MLQTYRTVFCGLCMKMATSYNNCNIPILFILIVIQCHVACNNTDQAATREQLRNARSTLQALQNENQDLKTAYQQLQNDHFALKAAYENLELQKNELADWAQKLAENFGPSIWYFGNNERPLPRRAMPGATPQHLIQELNALFETSHLPKVVLTHIDGTTAYVRVVDDFQLTHNMGTTGATSYIQVVTYTMTSVPAIHSVEFSFKEGDHALPGRYQR
jgi:hypothetical protein